MGEKRDQTADVSAFFLNDKKVLETVYIAV